MVRTYDMDGSLWIHGLGWTDDQAAARFVQESQEELGPALVPLGADAGIALAAGEEKVVFYEDHRTLRNVTGSGEEDQELVI